MLKGTWLISVNFAYIFLLAVRELHDSLVCQGAEQTGLCDLWKLQVCETLSTQSARHSQRIQGTFLARKSPTVFNNYIYIFSVLCFYLERAKRWFVSSSSARGLHATISNQIAFYRSWDTYTISSQRWIDKTLSLKILKFQNWICLFSVQSCQWI